MYILIAQTLDFAQEAGLQQLPGADTLEAEVGFGNLLGGLLGIVLVVAAILVFLYLIWGGLEWITAGGDKTRIETARNKITQAVVGLIVLSATTAIFIILQKFLGICVIDFGGSCTGGSQSAPYTNSNNATLNKSTKSFPKMAPGGEKDLKQ